MARRYKPDRMVSGKDLSDYPEFVLQMAIEGDFSLLPEEIARELSSLDQEQRARRLREHFESAERSSEIELRHLLRSHNPLNVLAFLALASHLRIDGKPSAKPTTQIHVELLQFLTLATVPVATVDGPCLHDYSRIGNAIKNFETACILRQSPELDRHLSHEEIRRQRASFVVRQNSALSRTWAYPAHLDTYIGELVQPLDERLRQNSGLSATGLIRFWRGLRDLIQARVSYFHSLRLGRAVEANNLRQTAATLHLAPRLVTAMEAELRHRGCEELNSCVEALFTVSLDDCILVSADERVTPETLRRYLQRCSLAPGKVESRPLAEVMVANPIWLAPLLALSDDCYFIALPSLFHSFAFVHLEREFERAGLRRPYESRRARYLEDKVESIIRVGLPSADVHRGTKFTIGSAEFENDLLVCLGNWLILIEAKSHKINAAARRGAPGSLDEQIRRLIERPSQQSARFAEYLSSEPRKHRFTSKKGLPYELNSADISRILRLNVSLEAVGSPLSTEVRAMQETGFISGGQKLALTMNLFDLAVVFEVLLSEEERADYLYRRLELQAAGRFDGEERDLLLFYVAAQMRTSYPSKDCFVRLAGLGRHISDFYPQPSSGMKRVRPVRRYTPFWRRTIEFLRGYRGLYWPEAAILLLTASIEEQVNFEKGLRKCLKKPASAHGLTITAQGWNETNVVFGAVIKPTAPRMPSLREQGLNQLRLGKADQVLLLGFDSHLHPVEVLMLTSRERPIWI